MKNTKKGFALLIAVIFMSVMLALGLALGSLAYKQEVLASTAVLSQYAFYAADAALECALDADQQLNYFAYSNYPNLPQSMTCGGASPDPHYFSSSKSGSTWIIKEWRIPINSGCADVTIYKYPSGYVDASGKARSADIFSQGYSTSCATVDAPNGARFSSRGLKVHY
ncbi:MAG: hypothetical protein WAN50_03910 [Minisyncoccia bacterium]